MTTSSVVLVYVYTRKHVLVPLPQDIQAHKVSVTQAKTQPTSQLPVLTSPPPPPPPPPEAKPQSLPEANLRQRVPLDPAPTHGPLLHPFAKAAYLDHQTGVESQILHPSRS